MNHHHMSKLNQDAPELNPREVQESIFNVFAAMLMYDHKIDLEAHQTHFSNLYQHYYDLDKVDA